METKHFEGYPPALFPWQKSGIWKLQCNSIIFPSCGKYSIIPLSSMLFKGINLKYELLCSGRKSPNGVQTRIFRNAPRYNSRLCSSFPHSFNLQTWCLPAGDLCSDQVSGSCYSATHSYTASSPLPAPCISTSLSSIHPIFSLIWSHFLWSFSGTLITLPHQSTTHPYWGLAKIKLWQRYI